jgi:hypothetical protein
VTMMLVEWGTAEEMKYSEKNCHQHRCSVSQLELYKNTFKKHARSYTHMYSI